MQTLMEIAQTASREAGRAIMELYTTTNFDTKHDGSPVTQADMRANEIIISHLEKTGIPILSEESEGISLPYSNATFSKPTVQTLVNPSNASAPYPQRMWIIDPLDGTRDFLKKNGDFAVMIGLLEEGRPILGVVYTPAYDTLYFAEKGGGAFITQGETTSRLTVSTRTSELRFVRSISHFSPRMEELAKKLNVTLYPRGSFGIKAGVLAMGEADFFVSWGKFGEWDVCANEIIVLEAGGNVTDTQGNTLFYGTHDHKLEHGIIFSNGACHAKVFEAVRTIPQEME